MRNPLDEWVPETPWEQLLKDYAAGQIKQLEQSIIRQIESLQDHIDTNIELRAKVRELEDRLYKEGIDP